MDPDPTRPKHTFDRQKIRGWTVFLTWPNEIFFYPKRKKLQNLRFLGDILQTQTKYGWPDPIRATKYWPNPTQVKNV